MIVRVYTSNPNDGSELATSYFIKEKGMIVMEVTRERNKPIELSLPGSQIGVVKSLLVLRETGLRRVDMTYTWAIVHWEEDVESLRRSLDEVLNKWIEWESIEL